MSRFDGRVAIITGGAGGIGSATARRLAEGGAAVAVADVDGQAADVVAEELRSAGARSMAVTLDVSDEDRWSECAGKVEAELGPIDLLHSNAAFIDAEGLAGDTTLEAMAVAHWDRVFAVNLRGAMLGCRQVVPSMRERGRGSIVITSSITALLAKADRLAYASSKAALISLARGVAAANGRYGIRCNVVAPGPVETRATRDVDLALRRALIGTSMIPRFADAADIANAVAFLLSDDSAMITGHVLVVDGGITARYPNPEPDEGTTDG
jgi:NAD(P)-dependent dehydrogenase (short-subunit alcohol dehydrogenase family)